MVASAVQRVVQPIPLTAEDMAAAVASEMVVACARNVSPSDEEKSLTVLNNEADDSFHNRRRH